MVAGYGDSHFGLFLSSFFFVALLLCTKFYANFKTWATEVAAANVRFFWNTLRELKIVAKFTLSILSRLEAAVLRWTNISCTINQLVFFVICERALVSDGSNAATALYSLMFYNVVGYCVAYARRTAARKIRIEIARTNVRHLAMSASKSCMEWTKAVTFAIAVGFMLFALCLEHRLHRYQPTKIYAAVTCLYYVATEKWFSDAFVAVLSRLRISKFENLESLWGPVLLDALSETLSFAFALTLVTLGAYRAALFAFYFNCYLSYKGGMSHHLRLLRTERSVVGQFRCASRDELDDGREDVCPVCLMEMTAARVTPCHHMFHADCLRKCLQADNHCPMCKRELKFD